MNEEQPSAAETISALLEGVSDFIKEEVIEILRLLVETDGEGLEVVRALAERERGQLNAKMVRRALEGRNDGTYQRMPRTDS